MASPLPFYSDPVATVALWENVALIDITGKVTRGHVREMQRGYERILARHTSAVGLVWLAPDVEAADPAANEASKVMLKALGERLSCVAIVFEDAGVRGVVFRTLLRGINVFVRGTALRPCGSLSEAAQTVAPYVVSAGGLVGPAAVLAAFHEARTGRHAPSPAP